MIQSFGDRDTERFYNGDKVARFASFTAVAHRKLDMLNAAAQLSDLRSPPGNHLEALTDDRKGQHSIRVNDQYRVCFVWTNAGPAKVEITD
jgi:proteic killer suppression protein